MDQKTASKTAGHLYSATTALLDICCPANTSIVTKEEIRRILSAHSGKLSIASVVTSGTDRAVKFVAGFQASLYPQLPVHAIITGVILVIYNNGDMTTEEYLVINNRLLVTLPDDTPTIISISPTENVVSCIKGTLLISWEPGT